MKLTREQIKKAGRAVRAKQSERFDLAYSELV